jgi:hypothetical protein
MKKNYQSNFRKNVLTGIPEGSIVRYGYRLTGRSSISDRINIFLLFHIVHTATGNRPATPVSYPTYKQNNFRGP